MCNNLLCRLTECILSPTHPHSLSLLPLPMLPGAIMSSAGTTFHLAFTPEDHVDHIPVVRCRLLQKPEEIRLANTQYLANRLDGVFEAPRLVDAVNEAEERIGAGKIR